MTEGTQAKFRNGEVVTVKQVRVNERDFTTCDTGMNTITVKAGEQVTFVVEFDDGEITIANETELEVV